MNVFEIFKVNINKLKVKTTKALFLIVPITILVMLSVVLTSQVTNIQNAIVNSVFKTISNQYTLIKLAVEKQSFDPSTFFKNQTSIEQNRYSSNDVKTVSAITGVQTASLVESLPVRNVKITDLVEGKSISLNSLSTLDSTSAALYTNQDFTYAEGSTIPIIVSSNGLVYTYEDWSGKDTITIDMSSFKPGEGDPMRNSFQKNEALNLTKEELIGKEITITVGGLDNISDYQISRSGTTTTITKLSSATIATKVAERKTAISKYWNYTKISTSLTYKFKIVGVIEDTTSSAMYIPTGFANKLMSDYVNKEITARSATVPTTSLNTDYLGLTYNGDELTSNGMGMLGQIGRRFEGAMRPERFGGDGNSSAPTLSGYNIPGLVIQVDSSNAVGGVVSDKDIYEKSNKYSDNMNIIISSVDKRTSVINALNKAGYAYQDTNDLKVLSQLQSTLSNISNGFLISFIVLVSLIVVLTLSKFISESVKEIGIFRAIGMKSSTVMFMYIFQSVFYTFIGYAVGIALGIGINFVSASFISSWFTNYINDSLSQKYGVINSVSVSTFYGINFEAIVLYTLVLLGISLFISLIPSLNASRISPVEAIKSE